MSYLYSAVDDHTLALLGAVAGLLGAATGVASLVVSFYTAARDESEVKLRILRTPPTFWEDSRENWNKPFLHVELMNIGKRRAIVYAPELLVLDAHGLLWYRDPSHWLQSSSNQWKRYITDPHLKIELEEQDSSSFFFTPDAGERALFVEVYDTRYRRYVVQVAPFATLRKMWSIVRHIRNKHVKRALEDAMLSCYAKPRRRR